MKQEWYKTSDLLGLPGLPTTVSGIIHRANIENWEKRKAKGKGRAYEYRIPNLSIDETDDEVRDHMEATDIEAALFLIRDIIGDDGVIDLLELLKDRGKGAIFISNQIRNIIMMLQQLPDEYKKEILLLANEAQYCALTGVPFKPVRFTDSNKRKSTG